MALELIKASVPCVNYLIVCRHLGLRMTQNIWYQNQEYPTIRILHNNVSEWIFVVHQSVGQVRSDVANLVILLKIWPPAVELVGQE